MTKRSLVLGALSAGFGVMSVGGMAAVQAEPLMVAQAEPLTVAQAKPPYNCLTREVWSAEKKAWCARYGPKTKPAVIPPSAATKPNVWHNCLTREVWTAEKQAWCGALQQMQNATYQIPDVGRVKLTNGIYKNPEKQITVTLGTQPGMVIFSDLTGNGKKDGVALLGVNTGGSANFIYLSAAWNDNGTLKPVAPVILGDRVKVNSMQAQGDRVKLDMLVHGEKDPACCPTQRKTQTYTMLMQPTLVPVER